MQTSLGFTDNDAVGHCGGVSFWSRKTHTYQTTGSRLLCCIASRFRSGEPRLVTTSGTDSSRINQQNHKATNRLLTSRVEDSVMVFG
jgi:hypothetical protein